MNLDRLSRLRWLLPALFALLLAGCATGGLLGGGYPGSGYPGSGYPGNHGGYGARQTLHGTVEHVDHRRNRIILSQDRYGSRIELMYGRGTDLYYRGRRLPVEGLEPGDGIRVAATRSGGRWWARSIEVTYNVREGYGGYRDRYGDDRHGDRHGYGDQLRGEVLYVDPRAQVIGIGRGYGHYGDHERIRYDYRTVVEYRGRRYRPANLERGDIVRIDLRRWGNGWIAERIRVERDVSW
jgi:hypothetical protein